MRIAALKKLLIITILALMAMASTSFAVPNLQIYIPGAEYDATSETWITSEANHEVWVIAANLNHGDIYDIHLVASLVNGETPVDGALSITDEGSTTTVFNAADFAYGTPPTTDPMPYHGVFPADYAQMLVTSVTTSGPYIDVQDYIPSGDGGTSIYGQIFKFTVSTSYDAVHYNAYGFYDAADGKRIFAPFSHDGEFAVPEPATAILMGLGLVCAGIYRRFRH